MYIVVLMIFKLNKRFGVIDVYSLSIDEKIDPHRGINIEFKIRDMSYITLPRNDYGLRIGVSISSFVEFDAFATHVYASFHIPGLKCRSLANDEELETIQQPKESHGLRIDVTKILEKDIYNKWDIDARENPQIEIRKGQITNRFNSLYELIASIESEYERIFGTPWILVCHCTDKTWKEYKKYIITEYV